MRVIYTLLLLGILLSARAQNGERTVTGTLLDEDGTPIPGVNVVVKGSSVGTVTNSDGSYSINAPIGSVLIFSFIGLTSKEVVVSPETLTPFNGKEKKRINPNLPRWSPLLMQDSVANPEEGVAILSDETPMYFLDRPSFDPLTIYRISAIGKMKVSRKIGMEVPTGGYFIKTLPSDFIERFKLQYSISIGIDRANKFPALQNEYSQGRAEGGALQWRGADQLEIFSWGPRIKNLEFDGSNYAFDRGGKLVNAGEGNGVPARSNDPLTFFKTGYHSEHFLTMSIPGPKIGTLFADIGRNTIVGIIPGSEYTRTNLSLKTKRTKFSKTIEGDALASFHMSDGIRMNRGANLASIIGATYRTPATFNNTNNYRLDDSSVRSHAPGLVDNPFGISTEIPDKDNSKRLMSGLTLRYDDNRAIDVRTSGNFERQWNRNTYGLLPGHSGYVDGRITRRDEVQTVFSGMIMPTFQYYDRFDFQADFLYQINHETRDLNRIDAFGLDPMTTNVEQADFTSNLKTSLHRTTHELSINTKYQSNGLVAKLGNRAYFSNTVLSGDYVNFFPSMGISFIPTSVDFLYIDPIEYLKIFGSWARTIHESSLICNNLSYLSTKTAAQDYNRYYESEELLFHSGLAPEVESNFEVGLEMLVHNFRLDVEFYRNLTDDFIAPINHGNTLELINAAKVVNTGSNISLSYQSYWNSNFRFNVALGFTQYNSVAKSLNGDQPYIPIAGFESTAAVIAKNEPIGAIYGTTYQRNEQGDRIIGADGFPLVDNTMRKIGNAIPDFTLSLRPEINYRHFTLSTLLEYKKGGDMWNGTQGALDYFGRSKNTANLRGTTDFIFDGIQKDGQPNTTPVDFYNAARPIEENKWVRYGFTGVGEEYIEDASFLRMTEISLSFKTLMQNNAIIKQLKVSLSARNVFLITPYSGVDPSTTLFGYTSGSGLDLFNTPATRSLSLVVNVKI